MDDERDDRGLAGGEQGAVGIAAIPEAAAKGSRHEPADGDREEDEADDPQFGQHVEPLAVAVFRNEVSSRR